MVIYPIIYVHALRVGSDLWFKGHEGQNWRVKRIQFNIIRRIYIYMCTDVLCVSSWRRDRSDEKCEQLRGGYAVVVVLSLSCVSAVTLFAGRSTLNIFSLPSVILWTRKKKKLKKIYNTYRVSHPRICPLRYFLYDNEHSIQILFFCRSSKKRLSGTEDYRYFIF